MGHPGESQGSGVFQRKVSEVATEHSPPPRLFRRPGRMDVFHCDEIQGMGSEQFGIGVQSC